MIVLGFDPGGETGLAVVRISAGAATAEVHSADSVDACLDWAIRKCGGETPVAAGIDTFLCWGTERCGWRQMDTYLRETFSDVAPSVFSSNSAYGAMAVQGMALAIKLREQWPEIRLNETHPKVLYHALTGSLYLRDDISPMTAWLQRQFSPHITTVVKNEHRWDALISAWATWKGITREWKRDLVSETQNLIFPAGEVTYYWPGPSTK